MAYVTLGYNSLEGLLALGAGAVAGSISLIGFGLDSLIEVASGGAALWRLRHDVDAARRERAERIALLIIGASFLALSAYVAADAAYSLWAGAAPNESIVGIVIAAASLVAMPLLARAKRRVAAGLTSRALHADATQTDLCAYLSAILLCGLLLNAVVGWWWADPVAALLMAPIIAHEGYATLRRDASAAAGSRLRGDA